MNMLMRSALAGVSVVALSAASASAATVLSWSTADLGVAQHLDFNGFIGSPANQTVIPGLTSSISYTLSSVGNNNKSWTFAYTVANTSSAPTTGSRLSSFGFDVSGNLTGASSNGVYDVASTPSSNIPNGIGSVDVCFRTVPNGNCSGGNGGLSLGQSGSGFFTLTFGSGQSSLSLDNFYTRYQSVSPSNISSSASGVPVPPPISAVPEPATWAMMITGFGLAGSALRRRRGAAALA